MKRLEIGDTIRVIRGTFGFRASAMYSAIDVVANSFAVVTQLSDYKDHFTRAAILRYVKKHKAWKPTKVIISFVDGEDWSGQGEGKKWERTDILDRLTLLK